MNVNLPFAAGPLDDLGYFGFGYWCNSDLTGRRNAVYRRAFNENDPNVHWSKTFWFDEERSWGLAYYTTFVWYCFTRTGGRDPVNRFTMARMLPPLEDVDAKLLRTIAEKVGTDEIHVCDTNGVIVKTTVPEFVGYVMSSQRQSSVFCCLLGKQREYAQDFGPIGYDASRYRKYVGVALDRGGFVELGFNEDRYLPIPDLSVGRSLPTTMMAVMLLLVFLAIFSIVYVFFRDHIIAPIRHANEALSKIAA